MAKAPAKKTAKPSPKAVKKPAPKKRVSMGPSLEEVSEAALAKVKSLKLDEQLQADLEWCLGSYRHDGNPVGLREAAERALQIFKTELARKTKGITAKLVADLESVLVS
jgi:hypothetical protein